jgi:hypothetical protein
MMWAPRSILEPITSLAKRRILERAQGKDFFETEGRRKRMEEEKRGGTWRKSHRSTSRQE